MASEVQARVSLQIKVGNIFWQSNPQSFQGNMVAQNGPAPGAVTVGGYGTDISFAQLQANAGNVGYGTIQNLDNANYVEYGVWDQTRDIFHPLGFVGPGEVYPLRLSPNFGNEYSGGPGTGTGPSVLSVSGNTLRFRTVDAAGNALNQPVNVVCSFFQA